MKKLIVFIAALGILPSAYAEVVADDFDAGQTYGTTPVDWSVKWDGNTNNLPLQRDLATVEAGVGRSGSDGVVLDMTQAKRNYRANNTDGVADSSILISADFRIVTTGLPLNNTAASNGLNGVNDAFIGCNVSTEPEWWNGADFSISMARRADDIWGIRLPGAPFITGWINNSTIGLGPGLTASTSDWFQISMVLSEVGTNWVGVMEVHADGASTPLFTTDSFNLPAAFTNGATLYGGFSPGWNPDDAPMSDVSQVSEVYVDNFRFGGPSVKATGISNDPLTGYSFTSEVGKIHQLQYSVDGGTTYLDTGALVDGDGTEKVLLDPAPDTTGRQYRVTSE